MIDTDPAFLRFLAIMAGFIITGLGLWFQGRKTKDAAQEAVDLSRPTGNGYANRSEDSLKDIKELLIRVEGKIDGHLLSHANNDVVRPRRRSWTGF